MGKEQGRASGGKDAAVDLGDFEIGRNRGVNGDKLTFAAQKSEKLAQVVHGGLGREVVRLTIPNI